MKCAVMLLAWERALVSCFDGGNFTQVGANLDSALVELRGFLAV